MSITIKQGRKYQTKAGRRVEIDSLDSSVDALDGRVLGRIFFPTAGQCPASWNFAGVHNLDGTPSDLDLVDIGESDRDRLVSGRDATAIREVKGLLEYVWVNGIDPQVFSQFSEQDLQSIPAKVVFDLMAKLHSRQG